jgi:transcriptional regulator with XRE-family HTH domain
MGKATGRWEGGHQWINSLRSILWRKEWSHRGYKQGPKAGGVDQVRGGNMTGEEVKEILEFLGLDEKEAAWEFGVSKRTIRRYMSGDVNPLAEHCLKFAAKLKRMGIAWRKNEVNVLLGSRGVQILQEENVRKMLRPLCGERDDSGLCSRCGSRWDGICGDSQR